MDAAIGTSFTPYFGIASGVLALAASVFVYRSAPDREVAWRFGLLLALEALMIWTTPHGFAGLLDDRGHRLIGMRLHMANDCLLIACYLPALAVTLRSPLLHAFATRTAAFVALALGLLAASCVYVFPELFLREEGFAPGVPLNKWAGPAWIAVFGLLIANYTFGLVVAILAWRSATGDLSRRRAGYLAAAFGIRDVGWGTLFAVLLASSLFGGALQSIPGPWLGPLSLMAYVCLTAYGIASANLFDIDLRVKWTLERGTVAAIFIAVFFMVSEGAASLLSEQIGSVLGIVATGGLVFLLARLQRAAERLADRAMPSVQDTDEYRSFRKLQIYGEAASEAMRDGAVTPVGRAVLHRLREQLKLSESDADALERDLRIGSSGAREGA